MKTKQIYRLWIVGIILTLVLSGTATILAQNYSFSVPELLMDVTVQSDGSAHIVYDITFDNEGSPIDIVDIGTPHKDYDISNMYASINGVPLNDIRKSEYIDVGVEIHLDSEAIPSGEQGTLHFEFTMPDMVYADTTNEENASFQITPTWFDSSLINDTGNIEIRVTMLEGIQPEEVLYQDVKFTDKVVQNGRVVAIWEFVDVRPTKAYRVGVSFPRRGLSQVVEITFWDLLGEWLGKFTGIIAGVLGICTPFVLPIFFGWIILRAIKKASKPNYLPPIAQVEGGGIKRGLTAPEAAVILELPLTKALALVLFGLLEKGLVRQVDDDPLTLEVVEDFRVADKPQLDAPKARKKFRRKVAQQKGTVIHSYEDAFLGAIEADPDTPVKELDVVEPMQGLVDQAAAKMKGFDLSDTQDYYRRVIERALQQAEAIGEVEQRQQYLDKYLPWVMLDRQYRSVLTVGGYHYWPRWARSTRTARVGAGTSAKSGGKSSGGGRISPTFGDVSASFAGWAETTMGGMAAAIMPTRLQKPSPVSSSSGGYSSSCACACAGCACACACAGGGR